jgi:geranylgeranyl diphosphate synthase type II
MQSPERLPLNIEQYMRRQKELVDARLDELLPRAAVYPEIIHEAMRYSVFAGGKRLRPVLALATGEALRGDLLYLLPMACALEMIHTYSLIHDDLPAMDNDDFRRGQPTAHKKYGEGIAILAGDALLTLAFQVLADIPLPADQAETKIMVIQRVARAIGTPCGMVAGQAVDLTTEGKKFTRKELDYIHSAKTGALIQGSVESAALMCSSADEVRERIARFGAKIGLAFQVVDDILDVEASSAELGKTAGKDRAGGKATYPALLGLEASKGIARELVSEAIKELDFLGEEAKVLKELARFVSIRRF